jgi:hypothetical protein
VFLGVAKGPRFRPQNPKGAGKKSEGPEKLAAEILPDLQKRAEKRPNFFKTLISGKNCVSLETNAFLS